MDGWRRGDWKGLRVSIVLALGAGNEMNKWSLGQEMCCKWLKLTLWALQGEE